ncbi:glutamate synthase large subunit [Psychroflexus sediminis]|uniref:Glutamate synthase [NADPH] large chain n=1 Tax=Psychroflexus sediminis TaxID=470826 RepID=A0A1G7Y8E0_9FLAO|nr:glutamate synthase large subunit [Psychroflexus sediminis]SDG92603.1 glutamate synthase (NADPH/NADH) large chain [Psychroflexus sediminis]
MKRESMYDESFEHDACGIGSVINIDGKKEHRVIDDALTMLENMEHRGGTGSDPETGDGAGILIQIDNDFIEEIAEEIHADTDPEKPIGIGMLFFPKVQSVANQCIGILEKHAEELNLKILGYRLVPVDSKVPGMGAKPVEPSIQQILIQPKNNMSEEDLERKLFVFRNYTTHYIGHHVQGNNKAFYVCSMSAKTIIYKGQLRTSQLRDYYEDLRNPNFKSAFAIIHSRFSTNTFPNWKLAQPFHFISHNGEINTIRGNVTKMKSKEANFKSKVFSEEDLQRLLPVTNPEHSDSANLDSLVEMLVMDGRPLEHVMMMLVPEAWQDNKSIDPERKAFYKYHASIMEPWDGPAALIFTDGKRVGATLDRNGLRPSRYCITSTNRLIISSEAGALPVKSSEIIKKGRLQPGRMILADLNQNKVLYDDEIKNRIVKDKPYQQWIVNQRIKLRLQPVPEFEKEQLTGEQLLHLQNAFGYTSEELKVILADMAVRATEPIGSMGADTPLAILSKQSQHVANYFKQLFAQVSNPPIDPIRERMVMSLFTRVGESLNILDETELHTKQIHISQPVLLDSDIEKFKNLKDKGFDYAFIDCVFDADGKPGSLERGIDAACKAAEDAVKSGKKVLILTDKPISKTRAPIPSLLSTGAVHHHLVKLNLRTKSGIVVQAGDVRETHHYATLIGYGASAVHPYLALQSIDHLQTQGKLDADISIEKAQANYQQAIGYGLLKILSKMGISTVQSYQSAQIFEALGLHTTVIEKCFKGTISRIEGIDFDGLAREVLVRHQKAYPQNEEVKKSLEVGGVYQWKRKGEKHLFNPESIHLLQRSTQTDNFSLYKKFAKTVNDQLKDTLTLRGLLEFKKRTPIPLSEVEPAEEIMKRFATGAMSFGSISHEAHSTLAIAMNRIGAKSNSGEGGEDEARFEVKPNGEWERSAIKQVASGRFGVTSYYLTNAEELQIKMAQGAKPGEGGQLPGHKVDEWIGRVRHSTPGVGLISPPPHHDIYSIEDLAQLIFDLKNANRHARINVKLVSQAGVGTVAAGVSKANADVVLISGADGGTGASPLSSIRHAGLPWELGLSEAHQTLVKNNLRSRITVQADGQLRTGRDIAIATLLGAEEWGISTAALIVEGCIMMRKCHTNTCPVGVATQNPELRKLFTGNPDHVVNYFRFLAEDLREIMSQLGFKTINAMVGHSEVMKISKDVPFWKLKDLDLSPILYQENIAEQVGVFKQIEQDHEIDNVLDRQLLDDARPVFEQGTQVKKSYSIRNIDRATGAILSNEISKKFKAEGLKDDTIHSKFEGSAGQSFGSFLAKGVTFEIEGESNDYFGKGLSGGKLIIYPPKSAGFKSEENIIVGNVAFYGATSGTAYINGMAGERFAVRNSGVEAVVEGVGDHACEYMTGGKVVILGETGKNFAAGMSGGIAYVLDEKASFKKNCNIAMVGLETPSKDNFNELKSLIETHFQLTGSQKAKGILDDFEAMKTQFVKIIPHEYKRILEEKEKQEQKIVA